MASQGTPLWSVDSAAFLSVSIAWRPCPVEGSADPRRWPPSMLLMGEIDLARSGGALLRGPAVQQTAIVIGLLIEALGFNLVADGFVPSPEG